jgi:branched-chain amino acid transport system ATP-binding protein
MGKQTILSAMRRLLQLTLEKKERFLRINNLIVLYGRAVAVSDASLEVPDGFIVALIGSNGAGKTTILKTISGLKKPSGGHIWFKDKQITHKSPQEIVKMGIAHVPEGSQVFTEMTILENLIIGAYLRKDKKSIAKDLEIMFEHFPILRRRVRQKAGSMSGGERQMLAVARAYMTNPKLLLLDEPSLGLAPLMVEEIGKIVKSLNGGGISVMLVEQNARLALGLSHYAYVLATGKITLEGAPNDLMSNPTVKQAYLGITSQQGSVWKPE